MSRFRIWSNTAEYLSLSAIHRPEMAGLYEYWREADQDGGPPRQKDLAVHDMPDCLDNIALLDVAPAAARDPDLPAGFPIRARYLMVGEALKNLLGEDPTGHLINEVYSEDVAGEVGRALLKSVETRSALYYRREFQILTKSFGYDRLVLPMRLQSDEIRRILLCIYPLDSKLTSAKQWRNELERVEAMEQAEGQMASAWAESLGYSVSRGGDADVRSDAGRGTAPNYFDTSVDRVSKG